MNENPDSEGIVFKIMLPDDIKQLFDECFQHLRRELEVELGKNLDEYKFEMARKGTLDSSMYPKGVTNIYNKTFDTYGYRLWEEMKRVLGPDFNPLLIDEPDLIDYLKSKLEEVELEVLQFNKITNCFKTQFLMTSYRFNCQAIISKYSTEIKLHFREMRNGHSAGSITRQTDAMLIAQEHANEVANKLRAPYVTAKDQQSKNWVEQRIHDWKNNKLIGSIIIICIVIIGLSSVIGAGKVIVTAFKTDKAENQPTKVSITTGSLYTSQFFTNFDGNKVTLDYEPEPHSIELTLLPKENVKVDISVMPQIIPHGLADQHIHIDGKTIYFNRKESTNLTVQVDYFRRQQ